MGNQWVRAGYQYGGTARLGKTRRIAAPGYEGPLLRASGPAEQRQGDDDYRSSGATEQQNYQIKPIRHNLYRSSSLHDISEGNLGPRSRSSGYRLVTNNPPPSTVEFSAIWAE